MLVQPRALQAARAHSGRPRGGGETMGGDLQKYRAPVHVAMLTEGGRKDFLDAVGAPAGYDVGAGGLATRSEE